MIQSAVKSYTRYLEILYKLIKLENMTLYRSNNTILFDGTFSDQFNIKIGLRQGDPIFTDLYNVVLQLIIRKNKIQTSGLIYDHKEKGFAYVDDLVVLTGTKNN